MPPVEGLHPAEDPAVRVALRPLATPLPLGFLALVLATVMFSAVQLGWIPPTGMGVLTGTWAVVGYTTVTSPPGAVSDGLGVLLVTAGVAMLVPAAAASASKLVPAVVMALAGVRFAVTGAYQLSGSADWKTAAGWVGLVLAVVALYAALALELEGTAGRTVLPLGRRGKGLAAVRGEGAYAAGELAREAGVRPQL